VSTKERLAALRAETHDTYQYKTTGMPLHWELGTQTESGLVKQPRGVGSTRHRNQLLQEGARRGT